MPSVSLSLEKTESALRQAVARIKKDGDYFWPYISGQYPSTESTAWCALALLANGEVSTRTIDFLLAAQNKDGGWPTEPSDREATTWRLFAAADRMPSDWSTAPALLALRLLARAAKNDSRSINQAVQRAASFLFDLRCDYYPVVARLLLLIMNGPAALNYERGFPWTAKTAPWVEPTSYSLIALKLPYPPEKENFKQAIAYAHKYMHDHACATGGWNHGSFHCLGVDLPPYTVTTAEALLALQDIPNSIVVSRGIHHLLTVNDDSDTALAHALSALALHAHGHDQKAKLSKLIDYQNEDGGFGANLIVTAFAALALATMKNKNILKFSEYTK